MAAPLKLISHKLCPYVQRAVIALTEKGVPFERIDIDLANKPDWFLKISPLGKMPVLSSPVTARSRCSRCNVILRISSRRPRPSQLHPPDPLAARPASRLDRVRLRHSQRSSRASTPRRTTRRSRAKRERSSSEVCAGRGGAAAQRRGSPARTSRLVDAVFAPDVSLFRRVRRDRRSRQSSRTTPKLATLARRRSRARPSGAAPRSAPIIRQLLRAFLERS